MPIIGYQGDNFSILGPFISYDFLKMPAIELSIKLAPRFQGFDDSDSPIFENMAERKLSMDAGLGLTYEKEDWKFTLSGMFDIFNRSNGYEAKANIARIFRQGPVFIEPSLSFSYLDSNHVDYYYGIEANEINASTTAYQGESAINTTLGFSITTMMFFGGISQLSFDYTWYDSAITNSPLVDKDTNLGALILFSKFF